MELIDYIATYFLLSGSIAFTLVVIVCFHYIWTDICGEKDDSSINFQIGADTSTIELELEGLELELERLERENKIKS